MRIELFPEHSPSTAWRFIVFLSALSGLWFSPAHAAPAPSVKCLSPIQPSRFDRPTTNLIVRGDAASGRAAVHRMVSHAIRRRGGKHKQIVGCPDPGRTVTNHPVAQFLRGKSVICEPDRSVLRFRGPPGAPGVIHFAADGRALSDMATYTRAVRETQRGRNA